MKQAPPPGDKKSRPRAPSGGADCITRSPNTSLEARDYGPALAELHHHGRERAENDKMSSVLKAFWLETCPPKHPDTAPQLWLRAPLIDPARLG
jgi:hypothetical protein